MISNLCSLGMGKKGFMSDIIEEEVGIYCENLANSLKGEQKQMAGTGIYGPMTTNIMWRIATGERFKTTDPEIVDLTHRLNNAMTSFDPATVRALLAANSSFFVRLFESLNMEPIKSFKTILNFANQWVKRATPNEDGNFMDRYLVAFEQNEKQGSGLRADGVGNKKILSGVLDLLFAGTDTSSAFMEWAVLYLMKYQEVQEKAFQEIKKTIGLDRSPRLTDKAKTPYCQAVIEEIMRVCPMVDINVPHFTTEDTKALGYDFPKNTQVFLFLGGIHKSPKYFENPTKFNPDRYMNNELFKSNERVNFFGIGKRRCVGEPLAKEEVYLLFVSNLQKFKYQIPSNEKFDFTPRLGSALYAKPYNMLVSCRQ